MHCLALLPSILVQDTAWTQAARNKNDQNDEHGQCQKSEHDSSHTEIDKFVMNFALKIKILYEFMNLSRNALKIMTAIHGHGQGDILPLAIAHV